MDFYKLRKQFIHPGSEYRGAPFWSWNDKLTKPELIRQVQDMYRHGMGGFFIHSREGLETEYLGKEWMTCVREVVKEAKKCNLLAWLYDEDRWPSGFAGGLVTQNNPAFQCKGLTLTKYDKLPIPDLLADTMAVFKVKFKGDEIVQSIRLPQPVEVTSPDTLHKYGKGVIVPNSSKTNLKRGEVKKLITGKEFANIINRKYKLGLDEAILIFRQEISVASDWYGGYPYSDNLNPESVRKFIETTYEPYFQQVGKHFGTTIPGIFTDEPHIQGFTPTKPGTWFFPWTIMFIDFFRTHRGYDVTDYLPYLFYSGKFTLSIRHDYWWTITELFVESYSKQLSEWCTKHRLSFTGHYLGEYDLTSQVRTTGAVMPHYVYEHQPGIDILTEQIVEDVTVKQCSSIAHQFGRTRVLSELYGVTGWNFTLEGQKRVGDWQFALGVNSRCHHLTLYSLRGCRKRDYPPSFNYQNTAWDFNNIVENYFSRLSLMLSEGDPVREVLFIHPITTAWCFTGIKNQPSLDEYNRYFRQLVRVLISIHYDFDFGDEIVMQKYAKCTDKLLQINRAKYPVVVIPPVLTLLESTVKLLIQFLNQGGKVIAIKPIPTLVAAKRNKMINSIFTHPCTILVDDISQLAIYLKKVLPPRVNITDETGQEIADILYQLRENQNYLTLFLANTSLKNSYHAKIKVRIPERNWGVEEWDLLSGKSKLLTSCWDNEYQVVDTEFMPVGSRILVFTPGGSKNKVNSLPVNNLPLQRTVIIGPKFKFKRTDLNSIPLDFCQYRFASSQWSEVLPVWQTQRQIRHKLGLRQIYLNGGLQRWRWVNVPQKKVGLVELKFQFKVKDIPQQPVYLVMEKAQLFKIKLNNQLVFVNNKHGWWIDRSFDKVLLPKLISGINTLMLACEYTDNMELEDMYLAGNFAVNISTCEIIKEPEYIYTGDWTMQGYPFYTGSMVYQTEFEYNQSVTLVKFTLGKFKGILGCVKVNQDMYPIPWRSADGVDVTRSIKKGNNKIEVMVVGSRRNLLGPLHYRESNPMWTGPEEFRTEGDKFTPEYMLLPYGLMNNVKLEFYSTLSNPFS